LTVTVTVTAARTKRRLRFDWLADVGVPALIRAAGMAVQLAVLAWVNGPNGPSLVDRLTKWDGRLYIGIAESGYADVTLAGPTGALTRGAEYAFYPLYSGLVALVHAVLRLPTDVAALTVSALAGMAAACGVHLVTVELTGSRRTGYLAAALLSVLPMAVTFQMAYAEALYTALAAFAVLFSLRGSWWLAGAMAFAAGLTRPTGLLVALVIPVAALWLSRRRQTRVPWASVTGATVVALAASPVFWLALWWRTGDAVRWFHAERRGWDTRIDFGHQTWTFVHSTLAHPDSFLGPVVCLILAGYVAALIIVAFGRWPAPVLAAALLPALLVFGTTNYWHSKPRLLLAAFILVVPAAAGLAKLRTGTAVVLLALGTLASAWLGAYMLCIWPFAI
jgi:hypothetical protein